MKKRILKLATLATILGATLIGCSSNQPVNADLDKLSNELNMTKSDLSNLKDHMDKLNQQVSMLSKQKPSTIVNNLLKPSQEYSLAGFASNAYELTEDQMDLLRNIVNELNENNKDGVIEIVGFADTDGSDKYNLHLGLKRAMTVANALSELGLDGSIVKNVSSLGYNKNVDTNSDEMSKANNRRVEISVR